MSNKITKEQIEIELKAIEEAVTTHHKLNSAKVYAEAFDMNDDDLLNYIIKHHLYLYPDRISAAFKALSNPETIKPYYLGIIQQLLHDGDIEKSKGCISLGEADLNRMIKARERQHCPFIDKNCRKDCAFLEIKKIPQLDVVSYKISCVIGRDFYYTKMKKIKKALKKLREEQ